MLSANIIRADVSMHDRGRPTCISPAHAPTPFLRPAEFGDPFHRGDPNARIRYAVRSPATRTFFSARKASERPGNPVPRPLRESPVCSIDVYKFTSMANCPIDGAVWTPLADFLAGQTDSSTRERVRRSNLMM
jgi:hypothetical protein